MEISQRTYNEIRSRVRRDLDPSAGRIHARSAISFLVGGVISLLLCGQFDLSLSGWGEGLQGALMARYGPVVCTAVCGVLFAVAPVVIFRLLSHPLFFRAVLRRKALHLAGWLAGAEVLLLSHSDGSAVFLEVVAWLVGASVSLLALGFALDALGRLQRIMRPPAGSAGPSR